MRSGRRPDVVAPYARNRVDWFLCASRAGKTLAVGIVFLEPNRSVRTYRCKKSPQATQCEERTSGSAKRSGELVRVFPFVAR